MLILIYVLLGCQKNTDIINNLSFEMFEINLVHFARREAFRTVFLVCVHTFTHMSMQTHMWVPTHPHICAYPWMHMRTPAHTSMCMHPHAHRDHIHVHVSHTYMHTYTCIHAHMRLFCYGTQFETQWDSVSLHCQPASICDNLFLDFPLLFP